ncbi:Hypothetical protein FKW44_000711 [Caligus rogercresseyi]|uniref:Uncharacterized protein n=1 Tax=Caligus rogercresseyi TaxID=217165 RepID=A0A7T8KHS8_CALRO|nr:Hypothetical protein FKW44_000711 [Caligus rogercresseyi]
MNPMEEGLFGWFTLNYLMKSFRVTTFAWTSGEDQHKSHFHLPAPPRASLSPG